MKKILLFILLTACHEFTEPTEGKVDIEGRWVSEEYVLDLQQNGNDITGTAIRNKVKKYNITGMSQSETRVFLHLRLLDRELIIFIGNVENDIMEGTIKENLIVKEITFIKK